ncbi:hypothetical protein SK128_006209, partial [Halocaridina rubra]
VAIMATTSWGEGEWDPGDYWDCGGPPPPPLMCLQRHDLLQCHPLSLMTARICCPVLLSQELI